MSDTVGVHKRSNHKVTLEYHALNPDHIGSQRIKPTEHELATQNYKKERRKEGGGRGGREKKRKRKEERKKERKGK